MHMNNLDICYIIRKSFLVVCVLFTASIPLSAQWTADSNGIHNTSGNVGIGTSSASAKLTVQGDTNIFGRLASEGGEVVASGSNGSTIFTSWNSASNGHVVTYENVAGAAALRVWDQTASTFNPLMEIRYDGNVGIGTMSPSARLHVVGGARIENDIYVGGNINAKYQDIAEWVKSKSTLPAGTVVIINASTCNEVVPSKKAYDTKVAGIISNTRWSFAGRRR